MKLYHFTTLDYLKPDRQPGTINVRELPSLSSALSRGAPGLTTDGIDFDAVWLTTDPEAGSEGNGNCVRIELKLSGKHRRLEPYMRWLQRGGLEPLGITA